MKRRKELIIAAGLLAGAAAMTGCAARVKPVATPTPNTAARVTAQPVTTSPDAGETTPQPAAGTQAEETTAPLTLRVDGKEIAARALNENDLLLLPLIETAQALGWKAEEESLTQENQTKRSITLEKGESRISVAWTDRDNTASAVTWQKDGLLIPVDAHITTAGDVVYVPAAFFEAAMDAQIARDQEGVSVTLPQSKATPDTQNAGDR